MAHPFELAKRKKGDVIILDVIGDLTLGEPEQMFKDVMADLMERKHKNVVVNLQAVEFMDSSGVGALVKSYTSLSRSGGHLKLLQPGRMIQQTLKITGLLGIFEIFEEESAALSSF